ncbi:hypothetical protein [Streptomyces lincolnensis]|uniref:hypothetical protein n=1 Tax=Streptomyces lincolnensis TaxID=1915 RepID=UPI00082ABD5D|nr:hypothetical protein [Streptomyces lincolnensis]QMV09730.1 hypothetical protein GJU35_31490 [Streptomyces lincolnensis]
MAEGTQDDEAYGRSADPAVDAAEHLAAAIGTPAWAEARDGMLGLLPGDDRRVSERIEAWAADAARHEGEELSRYLTDSLPEWRERIEAALADDPERAEEARRFADSVQSLLPAPDGGTTPQVAMATGHGTVNAVQNGNIYYQVVLGLAPRPRRTSLRKAAAITTIAAAGSAGGGLVAADRLATDAVNEAGIGQVPQAPLADPVQAAGTATQTTGSVSTAGASAPGAAVAAKSGTTVLAKAGAAVAKAVGLGGAGAAGVSVPVVATVVTVVAVVTTTVTVFVPRVMNQTSCDAAAEGRSAPAVLAEAARRVELTSFRYDVTRGRHHVVGAADPHARTAWFRQGLTGGAVTSGTIDRGKVVLPADATAPDGVDPRWVRADGAFTDAVDPAAPARELRSVAQARRKDCTFTGTLAPTTEPAGSAEPAVARSGAGRVEPAAASSAPAAGRSAATFTARIDDRGRLVHLTTDATRARPRATARYWDFGLTVTASAPPSGGTPEPSSDAATLAGDWTGSWSVVYASGHLRASLSQDGDRITGDLTVDGAPCPLDGSLSGRLEGNRISFGNVNSERKITFSGSVEGTTMSGTFETDCGGAAGSWNARRSGS